jgi:hypothetical protein
VKGKSIFAIGPFFPNGVTLLKQQVRALNLLYALHESSPAIISPGSRVAVIGGGIAGVTAAAGAAWLGCNVHLFEQRTVLCHLQHGCETRWLHPRIYHWPEVESDTPHAALPLLTWKAGPASEVTQQLMAGFTSIQELTEKRVITHLGATTRLARGSALQIVQWDNSTTAPRCGEELFHVVILAAGFGVEHGVHDGMAPSYWRNDSLNQPRPGVTSERMTTLLISGTGDGDLIDLARARIEMFNQGRLIEELVRPNESELIIALRRIQTDWKELCRAGETIAPGWLCNQFELLPGVPTGEGAKDLLEAVRDQLEKRLRGDTAVILNGPAESFQHALRLDRASLFNALIAYLLYQLKGFTYVSGRCEVTSPTEAQIIRNPEAKKDHQQTDKYKVDQVIVRHGTSREAILDLVGLDATAVDDIQRRQKAQLVCDSVEEAWKAGWWSAHLVSGNNAGQTGAGADEGAPEPDRIEFVPPMTRALSTTFVSTLNDVLRSMQGEKLEFRITLHRLVQLRGEELFQQIARYAGSRRRGEPGRVFDARVGLVGLVCRLGKPVVLKKESDWVAIWQHLNLAKSGAKPIAPPVNSMLAVPFFASTTGGTGNRHVPLVLFMDSESSNFFTDDKLTIVFAACRGFVSNLDDMVKNKDVQLATTGYPGMQVQDSPHDQEFLRSHRDNVDAEHPAFHDFEQSLTFQKVTSFDLFI